jgi:DNA polymerase-3 subunit delta'
MPNHLSSITGQDKVVEILNRFLTTEQIPHALLFTGPRNVGQHFAARQFIKELLKLNLPDKDFNSKIEKLEEPVVKYVIPLPRGKGETPDDFPLKKISNNDIEIIKDEIRKKSENSFYEISIEGANNVKISSIRDIKKSLSINFDELPYRLILLEDAHLMSKEAQNALLKSLEEPPKGVIFILISDKPEILLSTIKSRCWQIQFSSLQDIVINDILISQFNIDPILAQQVIPFSNGSVYNVFQLLEYGFEDLLETSINILRYSLGRRYNTAIKLFNNLIDEKSKLVVPIIIQLFIDWFIDVQKMKIGKENIHFSKYEDTIKKFISKFDYAQLDEIVFSLTNLRNEIDKNINLNLLILNIIFNISAISKR